MLKQLNIKSVISILDFKLDNYPDFITNCNYITLNDHPSQKIEDYFESTFNIISKAEKPILVHCYQGISRSATIVLAYLMQKGMTFSKAYEFVKAKRPRIQPNMGFLYQLYNLNCKLYPNDNDSKYFIYTLLHFDEKNKDDRKKCIKIVEEFAQYGFWFKNYWNSFSEYN